MEVETIPSSRIHPQGSGNSREQPKRVFIVVTDNTYRNEAFIPEVQENHLNQDIESSRGQDGGEGDSGDPPPVFGGGRPLTSSSYDSHDRASTGHCVKRGGGCALATTTLSVEDPLKWKERFPTPEGYKPYREPTHSPRLNHPPPDNQYIDDTSDEDSEQNPCVHRCDKVRCHNRCHYCFGSSFCISCFFLCFFIILLVGLISLAVVLPVLESLGILNSTSSTSSSSDDWDW